MVSGDGTWPLMLAGQALYQTQPLAVCMNITQHTCAMNLRDPFLSFTVWWQLPSLMAVYFKNYFEEREKLEKYWGQSSLSAGVAA